MSIAQRLPGANINFLTGRNNLKICKIKCQDNEEVQIVVLGLFPQGTIAETAKNSYNVHVTEKDNISTKYHNNRTTVYFVSFNSTNECI